MSAEAPRQFVDTNILVYAHDVSAGGKHVRARQLLEDLWTQGRGCLSIQVLQEFYVNITAKVRHPLPPEVARQRLEDLSYWTVHSPTATDVLAATQLQQSARLSFWDAMIIVSALRLECATLWSEDLQHRQVIHGLTIANPFQLA
jgi:predicted nucleic acid-binding protein